MKKAIVLLVVLVVASSALVIALKMRVSADLKAAAAAEGRGDYAAAVSWYAAALDRLIPSFIVPDVNRSKVIAPAAWKKEMESYAAWLGGSSVPAVAPAKRDGLLAAVRRTAARVHEDNFLSRDSTKNIPVEQFTRLWLAAYFARGVAVDSNQIPLAAACFSKGISIIRFSALTSYTYDVSLIDTAAGRRTAFAVFPESNTFVLAPPGKHLIVCRSSFQPAAGQIWRSTPTIIPITVPQTPSYLTAQLNTAVVRKQSLQ